MDGCETWYLTLKNGQWLKIFDNKMLGLRKINKQGNKLHNEKLQNLSTQYITKSINVEMGANVLHMGKTRNAYKILV
jgi:hypothetical protein